MSNQVKRWREVWVQLTDDCRLWPMKPWPVRVRFGAYVDGPGTLLHIDGMRGSRGDDLSV